MKKIWICFILFFCFPFLVKADTNNSVLTDEDRELYKTIFALQDKTLFWKADIKIKKLHNNILLGYVYAERYLHKQYYSKVPELNDWLKKNRHNVDALRIYNLVIKKKGKPVIRKPKQAKSMPKGGSCHVKDSRDPVDFLYNRNVRVKSGQPKRANVLMKRIYNALKRGKTLTAKNYIESAEVKSTFSNYDYNLALLALSFAYYIDGRDDLAILNAKKVMDNFGKNIPLSYWVYGLANYRSHNYEKAQDAFNNIIKSKTSLKGLVSAAAFFASKTALKMKDYSKVNEFLKTASENSLNFYGIIAKRALGHERHVDFYDETENFINEDKDITADISEVREILALLEIGKEELAYRQFKHLYLTGNDNMRELLTIFASENNQKTMLERLTLERGRLSTDEKNKTYYPVPKWQPQNGWKIDRALAYAFMRQESCFEEKAKSKVGARGLMQVMPTTAAILAKQMKIKDWSRTRLFNPEDNIMMGQKYIEQLLNSSAIEKNLFFTAIAYNAGPGNLTRWVKRNNYENDPLLFVESIPSSETRDFVKKVTANFWVYRSLLNKYNPSLDDVVSGGWPIYEELDRTDENTVNNKLKISYF